jgi:hypothetical protein
MLFGSSKTAARPLGFTALRKRFQVCRSGDLEHTLDQLFQASGSCTAGQGRHDDTSVVLVERRELASGGKNEVSTRSRTSGFGPPPSRQTLCMSEGDTKEEILWVARIQDICREGVRLLFKQRFEPGTLLQLEVPGKPQETPLVVQARVTHVVAYPDGRFGLGCAFSRLLTDEELKDLI